MGNHLIKIAMGAIYQKTNMDRMITGVSATDWLIRAEIQSISAGDVGPLPIMQRLQGGMRNERMHHTPGDASRAGSAGTKTGASKTRSKAKGTRIGWILAADETAAQCGAEDSSTDHEDRYAMVGREAIGYE